MNSDVKLYRKRYIPNEFLELKDDRILYLDDNLLITSWETLRPRADISSGISAYYRKEGYKISRHLKADGSLKRWYCDIICDVSDGKDLIFHDLLIDIILLPDRSVQVVDLDEAADALEQGLISAGQLTSALRSADKLLRIIREGRFEELTSCLNPYIK